MKLNIICLLLALSFNTAHAKKFVSFTYTVRKGDNFNQILKRFLKSGEELTAKSPSLRKTIAQNPKDIEWRNLKEGQKFTLFMDKEIFDSKAYKEYQLELRQQKVIAKKEVLKKKALKKILDTRPSGFFASTFFMMSTGQYSQEPEDSSVDISFQQNSPYTLGLTTHYYPKDKNYSFSLSAYLSEITLASSNVSSDIDVPRERGVNAYIQHDLYSKGFSYYGGFDYETFSTFNTGLFNRNGTVELDLNKTLYATVGLAKLFKVWKLPIFTKLSFAKSISTTTDTSPNGVINAETYDGFKTLLYLNYKIGKRWYIHNLFKFRRMTGPDNLNVARYGIGFGYILR